MSNIFRTILAGLLVLLCACEGVEQGPTPVSSPDMDLSDPVTPTADAQSTTDPAATPMTDKTATESILETATLGAGCYWCIEAVLQQIDGVEGLRSGFMGGQVEDPSYREVCSGTTGHAEVVEVRFDPTVLSYENLLAWFWKLHDPTTLNRQGADEGTQYRSAIFTHSDEQATIAAKSKAAAQADFADPIVTEITPSEILYVAKDDHQDYYQRNKSQGYCRMVIAPKLEKLGLDE